MKYLFSAIAVAVLLSACKPAPQQTPPSTESAASAASAPAVVVDCAASGLCPSSETVAAGVAAMQHKGWNAPRKPAPSVSFVEKH